MNYDEFRDSHDMEFHGKLYKIVLNLCQYRDKERKSAVSERRYTMRRARG